MRWASVRSYEEKVKACNRFGFSGMTGVNGGETPGGCQLLILMTWFLPTQIPSLRFLHSP